MLPHQNNYNQGLQSLKGIAALTVFFSHSLHQFPSEFVNTLNGSFAHLFFDGQISVVIFMALSGFFYWKDESFSLRTYFFGVAKKAKKIYVPFILVMIVGWCLCNEFPTINPERYTEWSRAFWQNKVSFTELIRQCTILFASNYDLINPPVWYLKYEVEMFIIMPLVVALFRKYKWWIMIVVFPFCLFKLQFMAIYVMGMLAHCFVNDMKYREKLEHVVVRNHFIIFILILSLVLLNVFNELPISHFGLKLSLRFVFEELVQGLGAVSLICIIFLHSFRCLSNQVLVFFGNISYEFYLVHFLVILMIRRLFLNPIAFVVVAFSISVIIAYILNRLCTAIISNKYLKMNNRNNV